VTNSSHHPKTDLALVELENSQNLQNLAGKPDLALGTCLTMANSFMGCDQSWPNFQEFMKEQFSLNLFGYNFAPVHYSSLENKILLLTKPMLCAHHPAYHDFMSHKVKWFASFQSMG
jgi:hypothetical protein